MDISTDLQPGDIIKRVEGSYGEHEKGLEMTFRAYTRFQDTTSVSVAENTTEGHAKNYEFVRRPTAVPVIDVHNDLLPGDKIRRICCDNGCDGERVGEIYTFKGYQDDGAYLHTIEFEKYASCNRFEFVERPKKFDIFKDLIAGDIIRRTGGNYTWNGKTLKTGDLCTFSHYYNTSPDNRVLYIDDHSSGWDVDKFEFVSHKGETKNMKSKLVTTFEDIKKGDSVFSLRYGHGKVHEFDTDSRPLCIRFEDGMTTWFTYEGKEEPDDKNQSLFWLEVTIDIPKHEILTREDFKRAEYIAAMKTVAKEYIDGAHRFDGATCALCTVTANLDENEGKRKCNTTHCKKCPWMVITGHTCSIRHDHMTRAAELLSWIEIFEADLKAEQV